MCCSVGVKATSCSNVAETVRAGLMKIFFFMVSVLLPLHAFAIKIIVIRLSEDV
jgi:hypothetical protein